MKRMKKKAAPFRARKKDGESWVYGMPAKVGYLKKSINVMICGTFECSEYDCIGCSCEAIQPETIGRYSEKVDINGTPIYEQDILQSDFTGEMRRYEVVFFNSAFGIISVVDGKRYFVPFAVLPKDVSFEVVGM